MRRLMAFAGLLTLLLAARPLSAKEILIPNVVAFARGSYSSLWGTEIRIINPTSSPKSFRVVDWIGSPRQRPYQVTVLPGETVVRGGFGLYTALWQQSPVLEVLDEAEYGAAVCEVDEGLLVLSRMLTTTVVDPPGLAGQECAGMPQGSTSMATLSSWASATTASARSSTPIEASSIPGCRRTFSCSTPGGTTTGRISSS